MKDVAARAGVGFKTVSRVINQERGVSARTAARVRRAAAELDYHPDASAGNLRRAQGRTDTIGLLVASVRNEFDACIHRAVEDAALRRGASVFAASTDEDGEREQQLLRGLLARRVDGLVIMPSSADLSALQPELDRGTPVIAVDRPARGIAVDTVTVDNEGGARIGISHLARHGHVRVAMLAHLGSLPTAAGRIRGARRGWADAGLPESALTVVDGLASEDDTARALLALLDGADPPTAVLAARNQLTSAAFRALRGRGLQHEVALLGFDDFEHADLFDPAVSVIAQDPARLGELATDRLFARLDDPQLPVELSTSAPRLIRRRSCGCGG